MIHTIEQAKRRNQAIGQKWFEADAMRLFNTRIARQVHPVPDGMLFVTSETPDSATPRRYTVRFISDEGKVEALEDFRAWGSAPQAHSFARAEQKRRLDGLSYAQWQDRREAERKLCEHGYVIGQDSCPCCDAAE